MSRAGLVVVGWAAWLTFLTALLLAWTPGDWVQWTPFAAAAGAAWLFGLVLLLRRRAREGGRMIPDLSPPTVVLVLGLAALLTGPSFGLWLILVGAGVALIGLVGLARELAAERRGDGG